MTIIEAIQNLELLDNESTIYAVKPWTPSSEVVVERDPEDGWWPAGIIERGFEYFLEVDIMEEVLEGWALNTDVEPSLSEKCQLLIHYATYDAPPA